MLCRESHAGKDSRLRTLQQYILLSEGWTLILSRAGINCQQKLHVLARLQQPQRTQNPDTCTPAVPPNRRWAQAPHACTHGRFSPFIPPCTERGANTYIFIVYLKYPALRALSTPSRHLQGRQWEAIPLSLNEERDPSTFPSLPLLQDPFAVWLFSSLKLSFSTLYI